MNELLQMISEYARTVGNVKNPPLTAERFVIAVIDKLLLTPGEKQGEAWKTEIYAREMLIDPVQARQQLLDYVCSEETKTFLDDLYMKKRMRAASGLAEERITELSVQLILECIAEEPSEPISKVLAPISEKEALDTYQEQTDLLLQKIIRQSEQKKLEKLPDSREKMAQLVENVRSIRRELEASVFGQDNAIDVFTTGYFQSGLLSMIDSTRRRPRATFLFAGPPGVGKTFLAEKAAEVLKLPFKRFDMSEYADKEANLEFCGTGKVYKNAEAGNVTGFVAENPRCVLLFDEIEKAHLCVIHLFLQILDAGRLRDNYTDEEVSFRDAIIILTTNAGRQLYENSETGDFSGISRKVIVKALQKDINPQTGAPYFPGALCSRFASGNVVMFNHISAGGLARIARKEILRQAGNLQQEMGIRMQIDERVYTALLFSEGASADARTLSSRAEAFFNNELYELLRLIASPKNQSRIDQLEKIRIDLDLTNAKPEVCSLFEPEAPAGVLVFAEPEMAQLVRRKQPQLRFWDANRPRQAMEILKQEKIDFVLLDMTCGGSGRSARSLNIEDVDSSARDFFKFLREHGRSLPVYLLEGRGRGLTEEERESFLRQGVRGVLPVYGANNGFGKQLQAIARQLHQQVGMTRLARQNKLISFETAQSVTKNGKSASIRLFDLDMAVAVDAEDSKSVLSTLSRPQVRFSDVIGARDAKKELAYFVEYLKNPAKYMGTGVKAPRGVLLYGPPGTGKTMLAKAMACESDVTFLVAEGNQFLKKYVGEGPEKVHELFRTARKYAPAIIFVDEIDAIARQRRGAGAQVGGTEEVLTAFLTEMDGFVSDPSKPVFVLAATNFEVEPGTERSLDPALMRRFDRRVYIELPNREDRLRFLQDKIRRNPALNLSDGQIRNIAMRSVGMSLAELDSVAELALRSAIREGSTQVTDAIFEEAFETFQNGEVKKWDVSQLERVARHEAGHALLCWDAGETPSYLTIVARGSHGGYMQHGDREGKAIYTRRELLARIRTSLGGRAAEMVCYGPEEGISTGASGDLHSATALARQLLCSYGMDREFGLAAADGPMTGQEREAVNRILDEQMEQAVARIEKNKDRLDALVAQLMAKNHLTGDQIRAIMEE